MATTSCTGYPRPVHLFEGDYGEALKLDLCIEHLG